MDSKTKRTAKRAYATMVTNFDSTEQKHTWNKLLNECQQHENELAAEQQRPPLSLPQICDLMGQKSQHTLLRKHAARAHLVRHLFRRRHSYGISVLPSNHANRRRNLRWPILPSLRSKNETIRYSENHIRMGLPSSFPAEPSHLKNAYSVSLLPQSAQCEKTRQTSISISMPLQKQCPATDEQFTIRPLEYCTLIDPFPTIWRSRNLHSSTSISPNRSMLGKAATSIHYQISSRKHSPPFCIARNIISPISRNAGRNR